MANNWIDAAFEAQEEAYHEAVELADRFEEVANPYLGGKPFANVRSELALGNGILDFYLSYRDRRHTWKLRDSLGAALGAFPELASVYVTSDLDRSLYIRFFNIHVPFDDHTEARVKLIAEVVTKWLAQLDAQAA